MNSKDNVITRWGQFDQEKEKARYIINDINLPVPWEFIYQNKKILLKVDQFGPIYAQAYPPKDIMLFKRDSYQKYSSWLVWIKPEGLDKPFCNFFRPNMINNDPTFQPENIKVIYSEESATYSFEHDNLRVTTELLVPSDSATIVMKLDVTNLGDKTTSIKLTPALLPYVNPAQLAPWDKPEWYLKTGVTKEEYPVFYTQLLNMDSDKTKRRAISLWSTEENVSSAEISYERFVGQGTFMNPQSVINDSLSMSLDNNASYGEYNESNTIYGYPPVHALLYNYTLEPGETKSLTQVLNFEEELEDSGLPSLDNAKIITKYFNENIYKEEKKKLETFFAQLESNREVKTPDKELDYFVNKWLPLQMYWVASLDRGWPSGMRGSRDSANDFTAMIPYSSKWSREIVETLMSCQRSDGWYPRQYSASGRKGKHDLRGHVDAGCWIVELLYEYLCRTKDYDILSKKTAWIDSDEENTIFEHTLRAIDYYLGNMGEHGLCKIGEGDWLDSVNRAGQKGRGESVTVSNQLIIALTYMNEILSKLIEDNNSLVSNDTREIIEKYNSIKQMLEENIRKHAYNEQGYFNSVFSDNGQWLFSDNDPDGRKRVYGPANWYSISSGAATKEMSESALRQLEFLKCEMGYTLYWPPMGDIPIDNVGRSASGDMPFGLWENGNVYNQGSHGFLGRALAIAGKGDLLHEVLRYLLPFDQEKHPTKDTLTPPYAIVNCWQQVPGFRHRGGLNFLTGSTAMGLRMVYDWMFGIKPRLEGLGIDPCIPTWYDNAEVTFSYNGHNIRLIINNPDKKQTQPREVILNGNIINKKIVEPFSKREMFVIKDEQLEKENNTITVNM